MSVRSAFFSIIKKIVNVNVSISTAFKDNKKLSREVLELGSRVSNLQSHVDYLISRCDFFAICRDDLQKHCEYLEAVVDDLLQKAVCISRPMRKAHGDITGERPRVAVQNMDSLHRQLRKDAPGAYEIWKRLQAEGESIYREAPQEGCSVPGNRGAEFFSNFCQNKIRGFTLDIGCGPQPCPLYLKHYPSSALVGMDPMPDNGMHLFEYIQGYAEYLPFEDASFDTIVMATSLDHTLLPQKALSEAYRVLRSNGRLLIWEGVHYTLHGSFEQYNPCTTTEIIPFDGCHLFRFSKYSLILFLQQLFEIVDYEAPLQDSVMLECIKIN